MGQSDKLQNFTCIHAVLLHLVCQLDILKGSQIWYQIIKLKYKSDIIAPVFHQLSAIAGGDISAIHKQFSAGSGIHTAQNIQCRRLAGTRWSQDDRKLALLYGKAGTVQGSGYDICTVIMLCDVVKCDICTHKVLHNSYELL